MIVGLLILCRNSMKGSKITHMWADFSLKTGLSGFTSVSLIREREGGGYWRLREAHIIREGDLSIQHCSEIPISYSSPSLSRCPCHPNGERKR